MGLMRFRLVGLSKKLTVWLANNLAGARWRTSRTSSFSCATFSHRVWEEPCPSSC